MTYAIIGLLSAATLIKGKKKSNILDIIFLIALFIIGGLSTVRPDYQVYYDFFRIHSLKLGSISEPLYLIINTWASKTGMTYEVFFALQVAVSLLLLYRVAKFFKADISVVLMLFAIFPFAINVVQIRNFFSFSIVIYGFVFLYKYYSEGKGKDLFAYIVIVILASLIHYVAAFFFICLIPILFRKMKTWKTVLLGIFAGFLLSNVDMLFSFLLPIIGARKAGNWLASGDSFSVAHIVFILMLRGTLIGLLYLFNHIKYNKGLEEISTSNDAVLMDGFLYKELLFLIITILPLELFIQQYDRLTRAYLVLLYIFISRRIHKIEFNNRVIVSILIFLFMVLLFYYEFSRGASSGATLWNTVFRSVFESNALLK